MGQIAQNRCYKLVRFNNKNMIRIRYVRKTNRTTDYYDVGKVWCLNIKKQDYYRVSWSKWFFNKRIVLFVLKRDTDFRFTM